MKVAALAILAAATTSCSLTVHPDGSKSVIVDGKQIGSAFAEVIGAYASSKDADVESDK